MFVFKSHPCSTWLLLSKWAKTMVAVLVFAVTIMWETKPQCCSIWPTLIKSKLVSGHLSLLLWRGRVENQNVSKTDTKVDDATEALWQLKNNQGEIYIYIFKKGHYISCLSFPHHIIIFNVLVFIKDTTLNILWM